MGLAIEQLDPKRRSGVRVVGLTEADLADAGICEQLRALWVEHGLIHFRSKVTPQFHVALSSVFGALESHPVKEYQLEGHPQILNVLFDPDDTDLWSVDGETLGAWTPWHSDLIFMASINHGGILRAHEIAAKGGATGFIDKIEAYDRLPDDVKARIEGLDVVYKLRIDFRDQKITPHLFHIDLVRTHQQRIEDVRAREDRDYPPVVHPLVFEQPETGRKVLNFSPTMAEAIHGMDPAEGQDLMLYLGRHITSPDLAYYHDWTTPDEMVLWDNWRMLHQAAGVPADQRRVVYRTTIAGDYRRGSTLADYERTRVPAMAG